MVMVRATERFVLNSPHRYQEIDRGAVFTIERDEAERLVDARKAEYVVGCGVNPAKPNVDSRVRRLEDDPAVRRAAGETVEAAQSLALAKAAVAEADANAEHLKRLGASPEEIDTARALADHRRRAIPDAEARHGRAVEQLNAVRAATARQIVAERSAIIAGIRARLAALLEGVCVEDANVIAEAKALTEAGIPTTADELLPILALAKGTDRVGLVMDARRALRC